ncbi:MAG: ATP-binding protein [Negativicutes bacterium]|nr:ATP-binding protein [Negativicutes bacterium]
MRQYSHLVRHSGNLPLFQAVEMAATAISGGHPFHIHAEGVRGTGKTTVMRAARVILPPIRRIKGCCYNCDPACPHCPEHKHLTGAELAAVGTEVVPRPFLEISHGAKIGTVVGSIDLGKLIDRTQPTAALLPGSILKAHCGVLFIDEVNRLADTAPELADVLLDVMGTKPGRIQVEETGLPTVEMPVTVSVWAASNPDEEPGALARVRKQLADRFDLVVNMGRPGDYQSVQDILAQADGKAALETVYTLPAADFRQVAVGEAIRAILAAVYVDFGLESLRGVEAIETAARLAAAKACRQTVEVQDMIQVVPLALGHRTDAATLTAILRYLHSIAGDPGGRLIRPRLDLPGETTGPASSDGKKSMATSSWWQRFSERLRGSRRTPPAENTVDQKKPARQQAAGSNAGGSGETVADPMKTEIIAPPQVASSLVDLPLERYVSAEASQPHE